LLFLYKAVLATERPWLGNVELAKTGKRLSVVLNRTEVQAILSHLSGMHWLVGKLL
jgi:hypothetical protein